MKCKEYCEHCGEETLHVFYTRYKRNTYDLARCKKCKATTRLDLDKEKEEFKPKMPFGI